MNCCLRTFWGSSLYVLSLLVGFSQFSPLAEPTTPITSLKDMSGAVVENRNTGLFVGVSSFSAMMSGYKSLPYAAKDAIDMAHLFVVTLKCIPGTNCILLLSSQQIDQPRSLAPDEKESKMASSKLAELRLLGAQITNAQSDRIIEALEMLQRRSDSQSLLIVYFASHGVISKNETFVAAENTRSFPLLSGEINLSQINAYLNLCASTKRLVILDACRERAKNLSRASGDSEEELSSANLSEAIRKSLPGTAVFTSCKDDEYSWEDPGLAGGVFTQILIETLNGGINSTTNELLTLEHASRLTSVKVAAHVRRQFGKSQNPWLKEFTGDILSFPLSYTRLGLEIRALANNDLQLHEKRKSLIPDELWSAVSQQTGLLVGVEKRNFLSHLYTLLSTEADSSLTSKIELLLRDSKQNVIAPPRIRGVDTTYSALPEEPWSIDIAVDGTEPLAYSWQFQPPTTNEWQTLSDHKGRILAIQSVSQKDVGNYRLVVTNGVSQTATSAVISLKLRYKPLVILEHPFSPSDKIREGESMMLAVKTAGGDSSRDPIYYRWQYRADSNALWSPVVRSLSDNPVLQLKNIQKADEGQYRVRIFNSVADLYTHPTDIRVVAALKWMDPPDVDNQIRKSGEDDFSRKRNKRVCYGEDLNLAVRAIGNAPLNYKWQFRAGPSGIWVDVHGADTNYLKIANCKEVNSGDYRVVVVDAENQTLNGPPISVVVPPELKLVWPKSQKVLSCEGVDFSLIVETGEANSVIWYRKEGREWVQVLKDMTTYHLDSVESKDTGIFKVRVEDDCRSLESPEFKLTVSPRRFTTFKLTQYPAQIYERRGNVFYDMTTGGRVLAATQVVSGFDGPVFAMGWHPPVGAFQSYAQVMPCGQIISVTGGYGRTISNYIVVGYFMD